jgi:hypothetical protein
MTAIDGIIEPPHAGWDRYIQLATQTNRLREGTPDGEYLVVDEFYCGYHAESSEDGINWQYTEGDAPCQFVYSTTKVTVLGGMFDLGQLLAAAKELKEKSHYWGVYLENVQWVNSPGDYKKRCGDFGVGSRLRRHPSENKVCERHTVEDMTDQEKALWANGLLMLSWGS